MDTTPHQGSNIHDSQQIEDTRVSTQVDASEEDGSCAPRHQQDVPGLGQKINSSLSTVEEDDNNAVSEEEKPPPLPPRPQNLNLLREGRSVIGSSLHIPQRSTRPSLQSQATTAVSLADIQTQSFPDGSRETYQNSVKSTPSGKSFRFDSPVGRLRSAAGSERDDSASILSRIPTTEYGGDAESLLGDVLRPGERSPAWRLLTSQIEKGNPFDSLPYENEERTANFSREFDKIGEINEDGGNEGIIPR